MIVSRLLQATQGNVFSLNDSVAELKIGQQASLKDRQQEKIFDWLSSPDPSSNHNSAREKQQSTTGAWFLDSTQFAEWRTTSDSVLWLHGIRKYTTMSENTEDLVTEQVL